MRKIIMIIWGVIGLILFTYFGYATTTISSSSIQTENLTLSEINYTKDLTYRFVWEGDSLFALGSSPPNLLPLGDGFFGRGQNFNVASNGDTVEDILGNYTSNITSYIKAGNAEDVYLILMIGSNDIKNGDAALDTYNKTKQLWAAAKEQNYKLIAATIPHMNNTWLDTPSKRANWTLYNQYILSDPTLYDYLARMDILLNDASNTTYFSDGLHPTLAGNIIMSREIKKALTKDYILPYLSLRDPGGAYVDFSLMKDATGSNVIDSHEANGTRTQLTVNESLWIRSINTANKVATLFIGSNDGNVWKFDGGGTGDLYFSNTNASKQAVFLSALSITGALNTVGLLTAYGGISTAGISSNGVSEFIGTFRINSNTTAATCSGLYNGSIYYDGSTNKHYGCNSTTWNALY